MKNLDAYFAGLFDGEGTVGIYVVSRKSELINWSTRFAIVGTYQPMIKAAFEHFGCGQLRTQKRQAVVRTPSRDYALGKQGWLWLVTRKSEIKMILERMLPYLIEKRPQAEIVLAYINGEIEGEKASLACKQAKRFSFPATVEPKKRSTGSPGELNPNAKFTWTEVELIRQRYEKGEKQVELAREFKVTRSIINRMVKGLSYTIRPLTCNIGAR
jgi:hypothetical protein